jgi:hypothetical protein
MQDGTQAAECEPMTPARRLQIVSALADGDLDTISALFEEFAVRAFPVFTSTVDWPTSLDASHSYEYTADLVKALVAASSRGLHVVAPLLGSISREDRILQWELPQLLEYLRPVLFVDNCNTLCVRAMETYASTSHGDAAADMNSRQAEVAATARSTGVLQQTSLQPSTMAHLLRSHAVPCTVCSPMLCYLPCFVLFN